MRNYPWSTFAAYSVGSSREPKAVARIQFDDGPLSITSTGALQNLEGTTLDGYLTSVSSTSQRVFPIDGRSEIGGLTVKFLDGGDDQIGAYDFSGSAAYARSANYSGWEQSQAFTLTTTALFNNLDAIQQFLYINNFISLRIRPTTGELSAFMHQDAITIETGLFVTAGVEHKISASWDGTGGITFSVDGDSADGVGSNYANNNLYVQVSRNVNPLDGYVRNVYLSIDGEFVSHWPCDEGSGNFFYDAMGDKAMSIVESSPAALGWITVTEPSFTDIVYQSMRDEGSPVMIGQTLREQNIELWVGYTDNFDDYYQVGEPEIFDVSIKDGEYTLKCSDTTRKMRKNIFEQRQTRLAQNLSSSGTENIYFTDADEWKWSNNDSPETYSDIMCPHTSAASESPGETVGYISIPDTGEIIKYTGIIVGSTNINDSPYVYSEFTGITRGVFGTTPQAVTVEGGDESEWPEIEEFIYLEMTHPQMIYALLTGVIFDFGGAEIPAHWNLGISEDDVDVSLFQNIGTDLHESDDTGFIPFFWYLKKTDGKKFIEKELHMLGGTYSPIDGAGRIGLGRVNKVLSDAAPVITLGDYSVVDHGDLVHKNSEVINQYKVFYEWDGKEFTRSLLFIDGDSVDRNGVATTKELKFKGLRNARHTTAVIANRINVLQDRYRNPPQEITIDAMPYLDFLEANDVVGVNLPTVQDYDTNTTLNRSFEVSQISTDWLGGSVRAQLFGSTGRSGDPLYAPKSSLSDDFYSSKGTDIDTLGIVDSGGNLLADATISGGESMNNETLNIYDFPSGVEAVSREGIASERGNSIDLSFEVNLTDDGGDQQIFEFIGFCSIWVTSDGYLQVRGSSLDTTFTSQITWGQTHHVRFHWDGDYFCNVQLDYAPAEQSQSGDNSGGAIEGLTISATDGTSMNGWIRRISLTQNGSLIAYWPCEEGPSNYFFDSVGTNDFYISRPSGWDTMADAAIYYRTGDLTIPDGLTLTIEDNVQLRIMGTVTVNGDIDGTGTGIHGWPSVEAVGTWEVESPSWYSNSTATGGTPGYIGGCGASDGFSVNSSVSFVVKRAYDRFGAVTQGKNQTFLTPLIDAGDQTASPVPTDVIGIPDDIRGSSGGSGGCIAVGHIVRALGGTGGDGGAGLCIISRGLAFGANGLISLGGADGTAGETWDTGAGTNHAGAGAGGGSGSMLVLLDGSTVTLPTVEGHFSAVTGATPVPSATPKPGPGNHFYPWTNGSPMTGYNEGYEDGAPTRIVDSVDRSQTSYKLMYIPES